MVIFVAASCLPSKPTKFYKLLQRIYSELEMEGKLKKKKKKKKKERKEGKLGILLVPYPQPQVSGSLGLLLLQGNVFI